MVEKYISINEAADLSGRSQQTIRRIIKAKKVKYKKIKTPQGFNYEIELQSLMDFYELDESISAATTPSNQDQIVTQSTQAESAERPVAKPLVSEEQGLDEAQTIKNLLDNRGHKVLVDYAPVQEFNQTLQVLIKQHSKEKENLFKLIEAFQNKVVTLETKLKSTEEKGKSWYRFW